MLNTGFPFFPHGPAKNSLCAFVIAEHPQTKLGHRPQEKWQQDISQNLFAPF